MVRGKVRLCFTDATKIRSHSNVYFLMELQWKRFLKNYHCFLRFVSVRRERSGLREGSIHLWLRKISLSFIFGRNSSVMGVSTRQLEHVHDTAIGRVRLESNFVSQGNTQCHHLCRLIIVFNFFFFILKCVRKLRLGEDKKKKNMHSDEVLFIFLYFAQLHLANKTPALERVKLKSSMLAIDRWLEPMTLGLKVEWSYQLSVYAYCSHRKNFFFHTAFN